MTQTRLFDAKLWRKVVTDIYLFLAGHLVIPWPVMFARVKARPLVDETSLVGPSKVLCSPAIVVMLSVVIVVFE